MINTGIHSKKKNSNEPFRWAGVSCSITVVIETCADLNCPGEWITKNHIFNGTDISSSLGPLNSTTFATAYSQSTRKPYLSLPCTAVESATDLPSLPVAPDSGYMTMSATGLADINVSTAASNYTTSSSVAASTETPISSSPTSTFFT